MQRIPLALCLAIGVGASLVPLELRADGAAVKAPATIQQFLKIRTPGAPVILPDGSLLLRDWPDGVYQLYHVTPNAPGANASSAADPGAVHDLVSKWRQGAPVVSPKRS